jgi:hypothetical protein
MFGVLTQISPRGGSEEGGEANTAQQTPNNSNKRIERKPQPIVVATTTKGTKTTTTTTSENSSSKKEGSEHTSRSSHTAEEDTDTPFERTRQRHKQRTRELTQTEHYDSPPPRTALDQIAEFRQTDQLHLDVFQGFAVHHAAAGLAGAHAVEHHHVEARAQELDNSR